jgi:hypothetical protein
MEVTFMQCVFSERLVKDLSTEFHEQFGHYYYGINGWTLVFT